MTREFSYPARGWLRPRQNGSQRTTSRPDPTGVARRPARDQLAVQRLIDLVPGSLSRLAPGSPRSACIGAKRKTRDVFLQRQTTATRGRSVAIAVRRARSRIARVSIMNAGMGMGMASSTQCRDRAPGTRGRRRQDQNRAPNASCSATSATAYALGRLRPSPYPIVAVVATGGIAARSVT